MIPTKLDNMLHKSRLGGNDLSDPDIIKELLLLTHGHYSASITEY